MAKPSHAKIQPNWILQFVTLIESMGSVVFTWGPFEVELVARPITILSPCFALDKAEIAITCYNIGLRSVSGVTISRHYLTNFTSLFFLQNFSFCSSFFSNSSLSILPYFFYQSVNLWSIFHCQVLFTRYLKRFAF